MLACTRTHFSFPKFGSYERGIKEAKYFCHFSKDRNCEVCLRTTMTWALCRRRMGKAVLRAEKFGDLITADHKVFNEVNLDAVAVQDLTTQWIQSYPCKTKTTQETEKCSRMFLKPSEKPKVIYTDNSLEFGKNLVKIYHGIIELLHLIDPRRMVLLEELCAESTKELLRYCCKQAWMKNGGRIPWNGFAVCELSKTSWQTGKL